MVSELIPKIIGSGVFIFIILFLLFRLYSAIRKVKGLMPLIDVFLVKLWGKDILGRLNKNGIPKENAEGENREGTERRTGGIKEEDSGKRHSTEEGESGNSRGNNREYSVDKGRIHSSSVKQSSNSKQRNIKSVRKYESIFKDFD